MRRSPSQHQSAKGGFYWERLNCVLNNSHAKVLTPQYSVVTFGNTVIADVSGVNVEVRLG